MEEMLEEARLPGQVGEKLEFIIDEDLLAGEVTEVSPHGITLKLSKPVNISFRRAGDGESIHTASLVWVETEADGTLSCHFDMKS
jgi:hypothetical protein